MNLPINLWIFISAVALGWLCTALVRVIAIRTGFVAKPNPLIPQHLHDVAYMGGMGVALGVAINLIAWYSFKLSYSAETLLLLPPAAAFLLLGLIDDLRPFKPLGKLIGQVGIAVYAAFSGICADFTGIAVRYGVAGTAAIDRAVRAVAAFG